MGGSGGFGGSGGLTGSGGFAGSGALAGLGSSRDGRVTELPRPGARLEGAALALAAGDGASVGAGILDAAAGVVSTGATTGPVGVGSGGATTVTGSADAGAADAGAALLPPRRRSTRPKPPASTANPMIPAAIKSAELLLEATVVTPADARVPGWEVAQLPSVARGAMLVEEAAPNGACPGWDPEPRRAGAGALTAGDEI